MSEFTQADVDRIVKERIAEVTAKFTARLDTAAEEAKAAKATAAQYESDAKRAASLEAELTGIKTAAERNAAWDAAGVPAPLRARLETLYTADTAAAPVPLAEWLTASQDDPIVRLVLQAAQPAAPGSGQGAPPAAPGSAGSVKPVAPPSGQAPRVAQADPRAALRAEHVKLLAEGKMPEARAVLTQLAQLPSAG